MPLLVLLLQTSTNILLTRLYVYNFDIQIILARLSYIYPLLQNRPLFQAICPGSLWARDNRWLLSRGSGWSHQPGQKAPFCPGWWLQPGQKARIPFCPGWNHQPGQKPLVPLSPSLSPRLRHIQLTCFLAVLGSG